MHGRIVNGMLVRAPGSLTDGERVIYNPSTDMLEAAGWMPIIETPYPATEMDAIEDDVNSQSKRHSEERVEFSVGNSGV